MLFQTYFNWAPGEPSYTWEDPNSDRVEIEDCIQVSNTGQWNDDTCKDKYPFVCKVPRATSKCVDIPENEKKQCGYPGISEWACMNDLKCCYNGGDVIGISCYHPTGRT